MDSFASLASPRIPHPVQVVLTHPVPSGLLKAPLGPGLCEAIDALSEIQPIGVLKGPAELAVSGVQPCFIFAAEAWPHVDDSFEGHLFFTVPLQALDFSFGCLRHPVGVLANEGEVLCIDPMELHWLQPGTCAADHWVALQWEVPLARAEEFVRALGESFGQWGRPEWKAPVMGA